MVSVAVMPTLAALTPEADVYKRQVYIVLKADTTAKKKQVIRELERMCACLLYTSRCV